MKRKTLYRYLREDGGYTVSPVKPEGTAYTKRYRLMAEEGMAITNGEIVTEVIDVKSYAGWQDCERPEPDPDDGTAIPEDEQE
jgi:hypothetical protein